MIESTMIVWGGGEKGEGGGDGDGGNGGGSREVESFFCSW